MHFSVHIRAYILQNQLLWPQANSILCEILETKVCLWKLQGQRLYKTRTPSLFTAVISFSLAAACSAHWTTGTLRATILLAYKLFFRSRAYAFHEYNRPQSEVKQRLSAKKSNKIKWEIMNLKTAMSKALTNLGKILKKNSSFASDFLINSAAHVWRFNFLGLPFLPDSLVSVYSPLCSPSFHMLIWLTVEQQSSAGSAHVPHQSHSVWMWESERSYMTSCHGISKSCLVSVHHQPNWEYECSSRN